MCAYMWVCGCGAGKEQRMEREGSCLYQHQFEMSSLKVKVKVAQLCPTLWDPMDYPVHGILQARIMECVAFPFSRGIFPTQGSNPGPLHCRWILYQLSHSHKGKPKWGRRTSRAQCSSLPGNFILCFMVLSGDQGLLLVFSLRSVRTVASVMYFFKKTINVFIFGRTGSVLLCMVFL